MIYFAGALLAVILSGYLGTRDDLDPEWQGQMIAALWIAAFGLGAMGGMTV